MKNVSLYTGLSETSKIDKNRLIKQMVKNIEEIVNNESNTDFLEGITYFQLGEFKFKIDASKPSFMEILELDE